VDGFGARWQPDLRPHPVPSDTFAEMKYPASAQAS
jgi:hypothetical protein